MLFDQRHFVYDPAYKGHPIEMTFEDGGESKIALQHYIKVLLARHDEHDALDLFKRADMTILAKTE